jgi:tripeptide aminopeptidase
VQIDTQSKEDQPVVPSTATQWTLANLLARELAALGVADVHVSDACMVYARIPANVAAASQAPTIGFLAHVDTSPAVSGANVVPVVHANYQGGDLVLPADPTEVIRAGEHPDLARMIGDDIITADGTTLLGSDDKSGIAAIMTLVDLLGTNPDVHHGPLAIGFTADEEVGVGIERFDVQRFGARFAYTVDGDTLGEINHETWGARLATITIHGRSTHPGMAKGVMVNAIHTLAEMIAALPADMLPETTEGRVGFLHPYAGAIDVERSSLKVLLRDFDAGGLDQKERLLRELVNRVASGRPGVRIEIDVKEQYRNMNEVLQSHPELVENALEAARRAGLTPKTKPIRGGTDGSKLTFRGLPCPNIFTGGHNFHSKLEFNTRRSLEKTAETLVHLVQIFAGR